MTRFFWIGILALLPLVVFSQVSSVRGKVYGVVTEGAPEPLIGANIVWLASGEGTTTGVDGHFEIGRITGLEHLVISYVGYQSDTVQIGDETDLVIELQPTNILEGVEVVHRQKSTEYSFLDPRKVEKINETELLKAACCNLSESFETNPSVDVSFTDAVTGTRQIQMLGLAGPYIQITRENIPFVRGLAANTGLTFVPGTWVQGMQLSKGAGSVINGFESTTGQINIELRKPETAERFYLNLYANEGGRYEGNLHFKAEIDERWSTAFLLHGNTLRHETDRNSDGFRDMPGTNHLFALNRWKYLNPNNGIRMQLGAKLTSVENIGGQLGYEPGKSPTSIWGMHSTINRLEGWVKIGKVFEDLPWRSWAIQLNGVNHQQNSNFGQRIYNADQKSLYANLLYQTIISNTHHQILMGASLQYDDYDEQLNDVFFDRKETVPGGFLEYTFGGSQKISWVAGLRGDVHNNYGFFLTPRLHVRYVLNDDLVLRASAGRGLRTANIIAENSGVLASSRQIIIEANHLENPYGLSPEIAWNYGFNLVQTFRLNQLPGSVSVDLYRTHFENQIVFDLDASAQEARFYNLAGQSYSNSLQMQVDYELAKRFDLRAAYRWYDVKTTYGNTLLEKPLVARNRLFLNLAYATESGWAFDYTLNWQGKKRIPNTASNPIGFRLEPTSDPFVTMHAQVTKSWQEKFDIYIGVENLTDYRQPNAILASDQPFSPHFDASLIWGPIFGRNTYIGLRYKIL